MQMFFQLWDVTADAGLLWKRFAWIIATVWDLDFRLLCLYSRRPKIYMGRNDQVLKYCMRLLLWPFHKIWPGELEILPDAEGVGLADSRLCSDLDELHEEQQQLSYLLVPLSPAVSVPGPTSSRPHCWCRITTIFWQIICPGFCTWPTSRSTFYCQNSSWI